MTAEIVNLRRARKTKVRIEKERAAAENRARFGRRKSDKEHDAALARLSDRLIEGAQREHDTARDAVQPPSRRQGGQPQIEDEDH